LKGPTFNTRKKKGRRKGRREGRKKQGEKEKEKGRERGKGPKGGKRSTPEQNFWLQPNLILKVWCHVILVCPYIV